MRKLNTGSLQTQCSGHQEAEDRQVQCDALEAGARNAERLQEELSLKAEELTSLLVDLHVAKKGQAIAEELAESLEKSVQGLRAEHSTCLAELSEAKHEAENLRQTSLQSRPSSLPLASLSPGECSPLGSTVAALRRARASLAAEAEKLPPSPSSPSSPSSASAGLKALQRLKAAAAGKPKSEEATDGAQTAASTPPGSKAMGSLVANRSKAWLMQPATSCQHDWGAMSSWENDMSVDVLVANNLHHGSCIQDFLVALL